MARTEQFPSSSWCRAARRKRRCLKRSRPARAAERRGIQTRESGLRAARREFCLPASCVSSFLFRRRDPVAAKREIGFALDLLELLLPRGADPLRVACRAHDRPAFVANGRLARAARAVANRVDVNDLLTVTARGGLALYQLAEGHRDRSDALGGCAVPCLHLRLRSGTLQNSQQCAALFLTLRDEYARRRRRCKPARRTRGKRCRSRWRPWPGRPVARLASRRSTCMWR